MAILEFLTDPRSVITLASFLTFVGIIVWTYVLHRPGDFDAIARLPLDADADADLSLTSDRENSRG